jgi:hypothetical protein
MAVGVAFAGRHAWFLQMLAGRLRRYQPAGSLGRGSSASVAHDAVGFAGERPAAAAIRPFDGKETGDARRSSRRREAGLRGGS